MVLVVGEGLNDLTCCVPSAGCWLLNCNYLSLLLFCRIDSSHNFGLRGGGAFWRRVGSCSLTLLCLGLASDFLCVLFEGMYCIAISALGGIVAIGFEKSLGSISMSMHAALLKYWCWIFWHMYRAYSVVFPWTMNSTGSQPWHMSVEPPTAQTTFLDGMRLFIVSPIFRRCLSPLRRMVAPLPGKIIILVLQQLGISLACLGSGFGKNGTIYASISFIWLVSLDVVRYSSDDLVFDVYIGQIMLTQRACEVAIKVD